MHKERERRESAEMKGDKLPSGRFMEGDLKELLHFSMNFHLLPPSLPAPPPPPPSPALTGLQHAVFSKKRRLLQSAAHTPIGPPLRSHSRKKTPSRQKDGATFTPSCSSSFTSPTLDQGSIVCCWVLVFFFAPPPPPPHIFTPPSDPHPQGQ